MDYSPPGSSVHRILQAGILEWISNFFSKGSSQPVSPALARRFFTTEPPGKPHLSSLQSYHLKSFHAILGAFRGVCGLFHIKVSSGFILMSISFLQCRSYVRGCLKWGGSIGSLNFSFTIQLFTFLSVFPLTWAMGFTSFLWNNFTENHSLIAHDVLMLQNRLNPWSTIYLASFTPPSNQEELLQLLG